MARKDKFDEFKLDDSDLDWSDFDEPAAPKSKNRSPIMETAAHAGRSALSAVFPRGKRAQVILRGMPEAATDAYQGFTDAHSVAKDVYAHTKDELAKTERVIKQQTRQLIPTMRRYLPKKLTDKVNKWSRSDEFSIGNYDPQQAGVDRMMNEVFGGIPEVTPEEQRERVEQATEERLRESIRDMKSDALMNSVLSIARDTHTVAGLASGVTLKISRKQLEIQYRTLFAIQDLAKLKQTEFSRNTPALEAIQKNTALPDYAKEDFSEVRWANVRRQAAEWMNPLKYAEGFMDQIRENSKKVVTNAFSETRNILSTVLGMGIEDDFGLDDRGELSPDQQNRNARNKGAGIISSFLAKKFINPLMEKGQNYTREELAKNPEMMKRLQKAKFYGRSATDGSFANAAIGGEVDGFWGDVLRGAGNLGIIKPLRRENVFLDERDAASLSRSAKFDRRSWLTLNEIIPAWLGRINTSIRRGYGETADEEYDITTRSFTTRRDIANRVRSAVANDKGRIKMQEEINGVIGYVDSGNTLSEDERRKFGAYIEDRAANGKPIDVEAILKDNSQLSRFLGFEGARKVTAALEHKANSLDGKNYELSNILSDKIRDVQHHIRRRQDVVDNAVAIHGERALRDSGIFTFDREKNRFGVDKDFNNPYVLYGSTESGKTLTGQALLRRQELERKIQNGSASADQLRSFLSENYEDSLATGQPFKPTTGGRGGRGGVSARQLSSILYGEKDTNLVELLSGSSNKATEANNIDRIIEAIRANNVVAMTTDILKHVKSMDEEGVLLATLGGGGGGDGSGAPTGGDGDGPRPGPGPKGKRRRIILGEEGLARRWGGVLFDTVSGVGGGLWKGATKVGGWGRDGYSWARNKFRSRDRSGPGFFKRLFEMGKGGVMGSLRSGIAFAQGIAGVHDIYDEKGKVVLQAKKLEAGEYWQLDEATNRMINPKTLEEIELGMDIVDNDGNVVLTAADLAAAGKLRYYKGGKIQYLAQSLSHKLGKGVRKVMELPGKVGEILSKPLTAAKDWFINIPDIYVKGESSPRLYAHMMRAGKYFLKENKRPIFKVEDITGPVVDEHGNDIISADDMKNPDFKLVDRWGRAVKSPLMRMVGRFYDAGVFIGKVAKKIPEHLAKSWEFLKKVGKNNPLTRFLVGDGKLFSDNTIFGGSSSRKTNHILIRIYKLLNGRLPGEPEDESWTEEMEKGVRGPGMAAAGRKMFRGLRARGLRSMRRRRGHINRAKNWFGGMRDRIFGGFHNLRGRAEDFADGFRDPTHDIGTRYEVEKRLYGRNDDVAAFYRDKLYSRGKFSSARMGSAIGEDVEYATNAAKGAGRRAKSKVETLLSKMVQLQEVSWFNTMRSSMEEAGAPDGQIRGMFNKFSERVKFRGKGEKGEYISWFKRRAKKKGDKKGGGGLWNGIKDIPILGSVAAILEGVAKITGFIGKWGILKPAKLGFDMMKWGVMRAAPAVGGFLATAASAVVAAVGWPVILTTAAVAAVGYVAYKIATNKYTTYLDTMRLAQYGYKDYAKWSSDDGAKARYLEKELRAYVSFNEKGQATCRGIGGKDVQALAEGYGIAPENKEGYLAFQAFMLQRFIPIYLRWLTALYGMDRSIQLSDVGDSSKVTKSEMQAIYEKVKLDRGDERLRELIDPRNADRTLWQRFKEAVTFSSPNLLSADEVMTIQERIKYDIARLPDDKKNQDKTNLPNRSDIEVAGAREALQSLAKNDAERRENTGVGPNDVIDEDAQVRIQVDQWSEVNKRDVDALESIRFKTYGLKRLVPSQVLLIKELEKFVIGNIDYKLGTFKGSWRAAISIIEPGAVGTPKGDRLKFWFTSRFLPTFMFYVCGFKRYNPTANPLEIKLTGGYLYELGLMVSRAYTLKADIRQSVWEVHVNPFGEEVNSDPLSVNPELETLKMLSKEADLAVRNMLRENKPMGKRARWAERAKDVNFYANDSSSNDSVFTDADRNTMSTMYGQQQTEASYNGGANTFEGAVEAAGGAAEWAKISTGNVGISLGEVAEGNYKELREKYPIGSLKSEAAVKAMIADVAQKMGVPPGVALGMAYAESKFNYRAKNPKGTAGGLFQFIDGTWKGEMTKYAQRYGIPAHLQSRGDKQFDPWANALLGVQFIRDNIMSAKKDLGGSAPPPAVAYLYHFMGAGGGRSFLKSWMKSPNALATSCPAVTSAVVKSNPSVFYGPGGKMRTLDQVIRELNGRMGSIVSSEISANPKDVKKTISGMEGAPISSDPAVNAGAANDPSLSGSSLPEDNANRRDEVMASAGARRADEAAIGAGPTILPGNGVKPSAGSANDDVVDNIEKQALADGLSSEDAAKVRAGAQARVAAQAARSAESNSTTRNVSNGSTPDSGLPNTTVSQKLDNIITILTSIDNKMTGGGTAPTSGNVVKAPKQEFTQPQPSLNVSRRAG